MPVQRILCALVALIFSSPVFAATLVLEYPRGRYLENNPPNFFKWNVYHPAHSLSLKVYRADSDGTYDAAKDLISRFDFTGETQSLIWPNAPFGQGKYVWVLESYDEKSAKPLYRDSAPFNVESLKSYDLRTHRAGALMGFGRGTYKSKDPNYDLKFDTTPTAYGVLYRGSQSEGQFFQVSAAASDFTIKGAVRRTSEFSADYSWKLNQNNRTKLDFFLGPSVRLANLPRIRSLDGTNLTAASVSLINPGLTASLQLRSDFQMTLYSQFACDLPIYSSVKYDLNAKQLSYRASAGLLLGQFWPLGLGGELQYRMDQFSTKDSSDTVDASMSGISLLVTMIYML